MYVKIEPSGCSVRKGKLQIRLAMYLDEGDYGYESMLINVPALPEGGFIKGYTGKKTEDGTPVDLDAFNKWLKALPTVQINSDFHNHFIQVPPDTTNEEIMDIAEAFLHEAYIKWACGEKIDLMNKDLPFDAKQYSEAEINARLHKVINEDKIRRI